MTGDEHTIPCPHCGYDIRGVPPMEDLYRCPECGRISNLRQIDFSRRRRDRRIRGWMIVGLLVLLVLAFLILGGLP